MELLLKRKIIVVFMVMFVIIFGVFSLNKLDMEMMPEITEDGASVMISAGALSSVDIETNITASFEKVIGSAEGVESYSSQTSLGEANISVFFEKGRGDESFAKLEPQLKRLEMQIEGVDSLQIEQWGRTGYYDLFLDVFGGNIDEMSSFTREILQPRLEALSEVREVGVSGLRKNEIVVELDHKQAIKECLYTNSKWNSKLR
jgi:multidrug efflux pump subunit AcrB